ncbi:hypothetical protein MSG28_000932 [Choristoneura fumiferana]|uniref:Uncharacterized protein n=1 Tax=Choristoneura fumiferana TaxID=7141 RepID=A0ACC0K319_CHOFU|nr:hypothetical protein MSG28_000932 [Choristoneura fumiferana]
MDESWVFVLLILIVKITCYEVEVRVKQGLIVGTTEASVLEGKRYYAFYGVPYARPPIKKLRFKDPVTPKKWKYPYDARAEFHGACAQPHIVQKHAKYGNEDCLYLNIYTPQLPKADSYNLKPVMVWIHGYAFASNGCHYDYTSETYERIAMAIKKEYFKDGISEKSLERFVKYTSDLQKYPVYKFIKTLLQLKFSKMFVYKFNYVGKFNTMKANSLAGANLAIKGAASGDELCYILKCEPMWENYVLLRNETSNRDTVLIKQMAKWWTDFAKTGDPTPAGQPNKYYWPATTTKGDSLMLIGKESKLVHFASEEKTYKFWNSIYDKYYKKEACAKVHDEL